MNFKKYIYGATLLGLGITLFASCDESKTIEYVPAPPVGEKGDVAYFSVDTETNYELFQDENSIVIPVYRTNPEGALEIPVSVVAATNYEGENPYTFPSSVVFEDGKDQSTYTITYNYDTAVKGQQRWYSIKLDEKYSYAYDDSMPDLLHLSLLKPNWTVLGDAIFIDDMWGIAGEFQLGQNDDDPNLFRIAHPYYSENGMANQYFVFQLLEEGVNTVDYFGQAIPVEATASNWVAFQPAFLFNDEGLDFYAVYPPAIDLPGNYSYVAEYQKSGLPGEIHLSPVYYNPSDGYYYGDTSAEEFVTIIFPDFEPADVSISMSFVSFDEATSSVILNIDQLGDGVTSVRIGIGEGGEANAPSIVEAIENDKLDYVTTDKTGNVSVPFNYTQTGQYTVVAISYLDEVPRETAALTLTYTAGVDPNEGWTTKGYVNYTDGYMCANPVYFLETTIEKTILTYPVELQEWDEVPGVYRLVNPYGEAYPYNDPGDYNPNLDCYVTFDLTIPEEVYIDFDLQTLYWNLNNGNSWGLYATGSWAAFYMYYAEDGDLMTPEEVAKAGYFGTYKDGKVTFEANALCASWIFENPEFAPYSREYYFDANYVLDYESYMEQGGNENPDADPYYYVDGKLYAPFCIDMVSLSDVPSGAAALKTRTLNKEKFTYSPVMRPALDKAKINKMMKKAAKVRKLRAQGKMTGKRAVSKKSYVKFPF